MSGEALGVGDHDLIRVGTKDAPQRVDLRGGAATTRRRVRFVRNKNSPRRDLLAGNAAVRFGLRDKILHHLTDVLNI